MEDIKVPPFTPSELADDGNSSPSPDAVKHTANGVTLIPRPSNDPRDPLNWPMSKKVPIVIALCIATFAGFTASLGGQMVPVPQSKLYSKTTVQMAYQVPIANGGMIAGGLIWFPLSHKFGRCSVAFWSLLFVMVCQVWSACMTHPDHYNAFMASRFFTGFFGTVTGVIGPRMLVDLFFLHQRGRVFTIFHFFLDLGTVGGPTISAFVANGRSWTAIYWWTLGLAAFGFLLEFFFLQDTTWDRSEGADNSDTIAPEGWVANRVATFLPGTAVTPKASLKQCLKAAVRPLKVGVTPAMVLVGFFMLVSFGFYVAMNAITPVWLQKPVKIKGYGFTSYQNALFSFNHWIGLFLAVVYGQLVSDRLPLAICARRGGKWKPEYRLYALWFPALICAPIGLGVFGACLENHWHWIVLAVAQAIVTFGAESCIPITMNYACEIFTTSPAEVGIVLNTYRIAFGLSVTFYITPWVDELKFNWTYGLMAFLQVWAFTLVMILMWKGHEIRNYGFAGLLSSEEGEQVIEEKKAQ